MALFHLPRFAFPYLSDRTRAGRKAFRVSIEVGGVSFQLAIDASDLAISVRKVGTGANVPTASFPEPIEDMCLAPEQATMAMLPARYP